MHKERAVWVKCRLSPGAFSQECVFRVEVFGGGSLAGLASLHYCYGLDHAPLKVELPREIDGFVLGIEIARRDGFVRVYLPDSEVYNLDAGRVEPVEADRVPLRS
jgi:hypothetical protein